jgi:hypothetical protein
VITIQIKLPEAYASLEALQTELDLSEDDIDQATGVISTPEHSEGYVVQVSDKGLKKLEAANIEIERELPDPGPASLDADA